MALWNDLISTRGSL